MREGTGKEEIARLLARRLEASGQPRETEVTVAELHRVLLPYPECRDRLGFATKAEYDVALLRFLRAGEYVRIDEGGLADAVERELASPEPGLAFLKHYAAAQLRVNPPAVQEDGTMERAAGAETGEGWLEELEELQEEDGGAGNGRAAESRFPERNGEDAVGTAEPPAPAAPAGPSPAGTGPAEAPAASSCRACGADLPFRAGTRFCPRCGTDQRTRRCGRCGEELESRWDYCPRCGSAAEGG